ncbi:hypothetical protein BT96DRAFT_602684 [Gymnopus androsaceus JB14]|uniref:Pentatricopeptide repeat-containing protein n=1 Tax=Gymnopus androsaceus JB14 TaxID=1447944 RepID=A0A6A4HY18_9AGAR|nr:hypothetical protein BT96DRAFT_602684 [Gymnopus androsaceus JB14]
MKALLRCSFPLLVISGHTLDVIRIVELVNERAPSFINPRILQRLLGLILRHRQFALATRLYRVVQSRMEGSSLDAFRQKLILGLHRGGANALAMSLHSSKPRMARSTVEDMVHRVHFRTAIPNCNLPGRVLTILHRRKIHDIPNIRYALSVLVLSNRPKAANRLFQRSLRHLDASTKSLVSNSFSTIVSCDVLVATYSRSFVAKKPMTFRASDTLSPFSYRPNDP